MPPDSNIVREDVFDAAFLAEADTVLLKNGFDMKDEEESTCTIIPAKQMYKNEKNDRVSMLVAYPRRWSALQEIVKD